MILPEEPIMPDNPTPHQKNVRPGATAVIKNEENLKQNIWSL